MKRFVLFGAAITGVIVIAVSAFTWLNTASTPETTTQTPQPDASSTLPPAEHDAPNILTAEQEALLQNPETLTFARRLDFEDNVQQFFQNAENLSQAEREKQAADLKARLAEYESANQVSAPEGLMVRIALAKLANQEAEARRKAVQDLIDDYKAESQARRQAWLAQPKPEFEAYKQQEKQIVRDVMAMEEVPQGMNRGEYLRQRLLEARIAVQNSGDAR